MKDGLKVGNSTSFSVEVTKNMFAQFEGDVIHPAYSTVSMVYHMEWISRQLLVPYLEDDEEGMGSAVTIKHIAPSGLGTTIEVKAVVTEVSKRELITEVKLSNKYGLIGIGEVKQTILPKELIKENLKKVSVSTNLT
ncbi:thioesterase family protein [Oceanobacillus sp. J11TS1]|uniref:thioesterase family protein n=1 Tax=Oceanobacillus sp. J11TS1 TaxID=2807191 RepID=UPI001B0C33F1|nr:thioesterase [Oceanobacillus sp. J11TS1]GIO23650.1 hypothetical protein J11TS1_22310 [Oceanobacillus sp. J11TS1]